MARAPKLSKKKVTSRGNVYFYWATKSYGGKVFGRTDQLDRKEAMKLFGEFIKEQAELEPAPKVKRQALSVCEVGELYLDWAEINRSSSTFSLRKTYINVLSNHRVGTHDGNKLSGYGQKLGHLPAHRLTFGHLEDCREKYAGRKTKKTGKVPGPVSLRHLIVSAKACFNWAANTKEAKGGELVRHDFRPFAFVPLPELTPNILSEDDLITDQEVQHVHRLAKLYGKTFADMMKLYEATGARTGELTSLRVGDWMSRTKQLTLAKHKRSETLKKYELRTMQVTDPSIIMLLQRHIAGKGADDFIFLQENGNPWCTDRVVKTFAKMRESTKKIREQHTTYCFRHLYITDLLSGGELIRNVAKMAGTSPDQINDTYGHFYNADLREAQQRLHAMRDARRAKKKKKRA